MAKRNKYSRWRRLPAGLSRTSRRQLPDDQRRAATPDPLPPRLLPRRGGGAGQARGRRDGPGVLRGAAPARPGRAAGPRADRRGRDATGRPRRARGDRQRPGIPRRVERPGRAHDRDEPPLPPELPRPEIDSRPSRRLRTSRSRSPGRRADLGPGPAPSRRGRPRPRPPDVPSADSTASSRNRARRSTASRGPAPRAQRIGRGRPAPRRPGRRGGGDVPELAAPGETLDLAAVAELARALRELEAETATRRRSTAGSPSRCTGWRSRGRSC